MKKLLVLAALSLAAAPAMASKARLGALANSRHLIDTQTIFVNPADVNYTGDFATLEFGGVNNAEGGFVRGATWGTLGAYLGHNTANLTGVNEQNPLDLFYGADLGGFKWGVNLHYSNAKNEAAAPTSFADAKESSLGISLGARGEVWDAYLNATPTAKQETVSTGATVAEYESHYTVGGGYWFESLYVYGQYFTAKDKGATGGAAVERNSYKVGVVDNKKVEGGNFFYGIAYAANETKDVTKSSSLPLTVGIELDAASWLVLRASATQSVLLQETENKAVTPTVKSQLTNDTTVAAGAGVKFGKLTLDGLISTTGGAAPVAGSTGTVDANNTLSQVSLTYLF